MQFFAKAVDARIAQEIGKLRSQLVMGEDGQTYAIDTLHHQPDHPPTDSEGAE